MRTLLREFWNKYQFRSKFVAAPEGEEWGLKALKLTLRDSPESTISCYLELRCFVAVLLIPVIYIFAGETGNQWFYLICAGVLSALVLGIIMPFFQVNGVSVNCDLPSESMSGDTVSLRISLKRIGTDAFINTVFPIKWLLVRANLVGNSGKSSVLKPMLVEYVDEEYWVYAATSPLRRGVYKLRGVEVYSCFPLGLAWWSRTFELRNIGEKERPAITVFPQIAQVDGNFLYKIRAATDSPMGLITSRKTASSSSSSVRGVREFVHGDSPRMVHWATSARVGRLLVREFETEGLPGFDLLLNLRANWINLEQFELAVSISYSLLNLGFKLGGAPDFIVIPNLDGDSRYLPPFMADMPSMPHGLSRAAQLLARVEPLKLGKTNANQAFNLGETAHQALLTVRPTINQNPDSNIVYETVDLAVIPRTWEAAFGLTGATKDQSHMPMHEKGITNRRQGGGNPLGRVIATLENLEEVVRL